MSKLITPTNPPISVSAIWLVASGKDVIVLAEIDGVWVEIIREFADGPYSHICEAHGMRSRARAKMENGHG